MKKKLSRTLTVGAAALGALAFTASPASAGTVGASNAGASGSGEFHYTSKTRAEHIYLELIDRAADGHHVRIRVQSLTPNREVTSYAWRSVTTGAGTAGTWLTSLTDTRGIWALRIQACVFEGNTALGCDESSWDGNIYY
ncbi:hypothetical protein OG828_24775 [Streptomyces sp. NBC_00457]|uniref:hypothetical protein n=1 Tax=unclassified Streptomyces TaxID=2593676 RepID=UPI002E1A74D4|nr:MULTISPECIES: hypothetical protein [unclassified Streptomyces]